MENNYEVIIVGCGPAGMTAAIYLKRAGINTLIIEKSSPGGTLNKAYKIENYPGFLDQDGTTLAFRMYSQVEELDIKMKIEEVTDILKDNTGFTIKTNKDIYTSKYIILATGKTPRKLEVLDKRIENLKGISYCALCDGALYKDKDIAIIGGGNSAMQALNYMSDIAKKIYVINRSSNLRAEKKEQEEAIRLKNVEFIYNRKVTNIIDNENKVKQVILDNGTKLDVDGVFVCIGYDFNLTYCDNLNINKDNNGIIVDKNMKTNIDNLYGVGDIVSKNVYQIVTATSEGAIAASNIIEKSKIHF